MKKNLFDIAIVGGGIVGCATARELLLRNPSLKIAIIEKESSLARHQSGNNSGVIHAGIYYSKGSLKAKLCVSGCHSLYNYLNEKGIPYNKCGKLIVATTPQEVPLLKDLLERGTFNGVRDLQLIDPHEAKEIEPRVKCIQALWSPHTGIVDYTQVTKSYADDVVSASRNRGEESSRIITSFHVSSFEADEKEAVIWLNDSTSNRNNRVGSRFVVTAGGLFADRLSVLTGSPKLPAIIPFRGEYLVLRHRTAGTSNTSLTYSRKHKQDEGHDKNSKNQQSSYDRDFRTNIYPVPDPRFPFLGVHFTPRMDGSVIIGPNAVFSLSREGYSRTSFNAGDALGSLFHPGFRKLCVKYFDTGLTELLRSYSLSRQVKYINRMIDPPLTTEDVERGPTGVRAQAVDANGNLIEDFVFDGGKGPFEGKVLHVRNASSPAATSSLEVARVIADQVQKSLNC